MDNRDIKPEIRVDSSLLRVSGCRRRVKWMLEGYHETSNPNAIVGDAIHKYLQYSSHGDKDAKIKVLNNYSGPDTSMILNAITALEISGGAIPKPTTLIGNISATEIYFKKNISKLDDPYNISVCGTIDRISFEDGCVQVIDLKTTRKYDQEKYFSEFNTDPQPLFYMWYLWKYGKDILNPVEWSAIQEGKLMARIAALFLTQKPMPKLRLSPPITYSPNHLAEFDAYLCYEAIPRIENALENPSKDGLALNLCSNQYCPFTFCCIRDESIIDAMPKTEEGWNPATWRQ